MTDGNVRFRQKDAETMRIKRCVVFMPGEQSAKEANRWIFPFQSSRHGPGKLCEHARPSLRDFQDFRLTAMYGVEHCRSEARNGHFVGLHRPRSEIGERIKRELLQDTLGEGRQMLLQIKTGQHQSQGLPREIVSAASITDNVPPTSSFFCSC